MQNIQIRPAVAGDSETIYNFILAMARYEKLEGEVDTTAEKLHKALFEEKQAEVLIAESEGVPIGFALYFHNFSTFRGQRGLYLEEIFVLEEHRNKGCGKVLFRELIRIAVERKCRRMEWVVLDWNAPAIALYRSLGALPMEGWSTFRLGEEQLLKLHQEF